MINKNFAFKHPETGETLWYSRSCAVTGIILKKESNKVFVLANKRGPGAPDFVGFWNMPCGYLDFNESGEQAVQRETKEETGYITKLENWKLYGVQTDPSSNKQNVTIRYIYLWGKNDINVPKDLVGGEENEVEDIKWIPINEIDKYKWAFDHDKLIKEVSKKIKK